MTWGDLKKEIEEAGVQDEMEIEYIDLGACRSPLEICPANKTDGVIIYG